MSFKKFLKNVSLPNAKMGTTRNSYSGTNMIYSKYKNYLPMVYQGPNNRMERYTIYDGMEQDPIISWSLDIIADSIAASARSIVTKVPSEIVNILTIVLLLNGRIFAHSGLFNSFRFLTSLAFNSALKRLLK